MRIARQTGHRVGASIWAWSVALILGGCFIDPVCTTDADCPESQFYVIAPGYNGGKCISSCQVDDDCPAQQYCELNTGNCVEPGCVTANDCFTGFACENHYCKAEAVFFCPDGMVVVDQSFCIDVYEASRQDATEISRGVDDSKAMSRYGVLPWQVTDNGAAQEVCKAAGKSLCTETQWLRACEGPEQTRYGYGDEYDAAVCNGINTYCYCDEGSCASAETCPYPFCYYSCGAKYHLVPTGSFPGCTNAYGVYDMNGNLWEHTKNGNDMMVRGGAYNCGDSSTLHQCGYVPGSWAPSARGCRCAAFHSEQGDVAMSRVWGWSIGVTLLCSAIIAEAGESMCIPCEVDALASAVQQGNSGDAVERLKKLREKYPMERAVVLLLANVYAADDNRFWALNVLYQWLSEHPGDCEVVSHVAWHHIKDGNVDEAKALLKTETCPGSSEVLQTRWALLAHALDSVAGKAANVPTDLSRAYPEDREMWDDIWNDARNGRMVPLQFELESQFGYSTHAIAGSPVDSTDRTADSAIGRLALKAALVLATGRLVRPFLELSERLHGLTDDAVQPYSYLDSAVRPGLYIGNEIPLRLSYMGNLLLMNMPGQKKFYETHRLEVDAGTSGGLLLFAGAGRRIFRQYGRTRWEVDLGMGVSGAMNRWMRPLLVVNGHW